jgi:WNK lysine deficient protein kinase
VQDVRNDIFAFGLCMLELLTLKQLDPQHYGEVPQLLTQVGRNGLVGGYPGLDSPALRVANGSRASYHPLAAAAAAAAVPSPQVADEGAARFIASCVGSPEQRHTATQLLEDPFLTVRVLVCGGGVLWLLDTAPEACAAGQCSRSTHRPAS